ncbi:MAG: RNA polymerase factor sigma-32 [Anaeromyxobacteraceae bacterium]
MSRESVPSTSSSLERYLAEISKLPLLTLDEEQRLARVYREKGDSHAAHRLVTANLRFVVKVSYEYRSYGFKIADLVQEGNIGLMKAVQKFDPDKGIRLISYAVWWIRAYIQNYILKSWSLVKLGTTQAQRKLFFNLAKEREKLIARGIDPTPRLLAKNLQVEEHEVEEMAARMGSDDLSLDEPLRGDDEGARQTRLDRFAGATASADDALGAEQLRRLFREKLEAFAATITDEKERYIFEHRLLPPDGVEPLTLQEVGTHFKLTRERARQIEAKLTARLREHVKAEIPDFELLTPAD